MTRETTLEAFSNASVEAPRVQTTMAWTPDGATCAACNSQVTRRWRDEGQLVCEDCKQWHGS